MEAMKSVSVTYRFRLKDKHSKWLNAQARAVNYVWNFCNETQKHALRWGKRWPSGYDLCNLTAGSSAELNLHSGTIQRTCLLYEISRKQSNKASLRWRGKKSLGWVPFNTGHIAWRDGALFFRKIRLGAWYSRSIPSGAKLGVGSFNQDSQGRWYVNVLATYDINESTIPAGSATIGVDLGLKTLATYSDGSSFEVPRWYRRSQEKLAIVQRAKKAKQMKAIHAKIANQRADALHKETTRLCREFCAIFVGNVNAAGLARTRMAKSVLDSGWSIFRKQLKYKAIRHSVVFGEVNESFSTQTCSSCGEISSASPKGRAGLGIRRWTCHCGAEHDRDINAAINIARCGCASLAVGIPELPREDTNAEVRVLTQQVELEFS